jgi:hypothetical protein
MIVGVGSTGLGIRQQYQNGVGAGYTSAGAILPKGDTSPSHLVVGQLRYLLACLHR